jgi:hypothetical protein
MKRVYNTQTQQYYNVDRVYPHELVLNDFPEDFEETIEPKIKENFGNYKSFYKPVIENGVHTGWEIDQEKFKSERTEQIFDRLKEIDIESIRPQRAVQVGLHTQEDLDKLLQLEQEAQSLRIELKQI